MGKILICQIIETVEVSCKMKKMGTIIDHLKKGGGNPLRHQNPYFQEALHLGSYLMTQTELEQQYPALLWKGNKPLILEIGCYMGKNVLELATQNPDKNILGFDLTYKRAVKSARKLQRAQLQNAAISLCDAAVFFSSLAFDNSLHGVCLFFPDPWPKERHKKNRLLSPTFANLLYKKISHGGFFWLKTDCQKYFDQGQTFLRDVGFEESCFSQPSTLQGGPYETVFQKLFVEKEIPFFEKVYLKK